MNRISILRGVLMLLLALVLVSTFVPCAQAQKPGEKPTQTLNVGFLIALTGPGTLSDMGKETQVGLTAYLQDLEAWGGIRVGGQRYMIKPIIYDDKGGDTAAARDAVNRLILQDGVKFIGYTLWSPTTIAISPIIEEHKVLTMGDGGAPECVNPKTTYFFRTTSPMTLTGPAMYKWISTNMPNIKRVAIITNNDAVGRAALAAAEQARDKWGFQIVDIGWITRATTDVSSQVGKAMARTPDIIDMSCGNPALVLKQSREMGYKGLILDYDGWHPMPVIASLGWGPVQNLISMAVNPDDPMLPKGYADFVRRMHAQGQPGSWWSESMYNGLWILKQAMEKANSLNPQEVQKVMHTMEFDVLSGKGRFVGKESFGIDNQLGLYVYFSMVEGEKYKMLGKIEIK